MNKEFTFEYRNLQDILVSDNSSFHINKKQYETLSNNPFRHEENIPAQICALSEGETVGSILCFPSKIIAEGKEYVCNSGSSLYVNPKYRGHGIGTKLGIKRLNASKNKISLAAGLSNMSLPIYKKLGCVIFYPKRFNIVRNSKIFLANWLNGLPLTIATSLLNLILKIQQGLIECYIKFHLKGVTVHKLNKATNDIENIFNSDCHKFKEYHNKSWFNWHLNNCMTEHTLNKQFLYLIKHDNESVGFIMIKTRYKESAGKGKLKNALIGSIIEWGSSDLRIVDNKKLCILGIDILLKKKVDIIDIFSDDKNTIKFLRNIGCIKNGVGNFAVFAGEGSPLKQYSGYDKQENWRIRPATSDNGLS